MADAYTRLTDTIVPEVWARYSFEESVAKLGLYQTGVIYSDPEITGRMAQGGYAVDMPMWDDLPTIASEPVNDDPTDMIEVKKVGSRKERAARNIRAQAWGNMDVNAILAGDDPQRIIVQRQASYWQRAHQLTIYSMLRGIVADNVANDDGDLVRDTDTTIADTDMIDAAFLMGDRADAFTTIIMHSKQMQTLRKADMIDFIPSSQTGGPILPYYQGLRVIVDDDVDATPGTDVTEYTAYLFKPRAIVWAELPVMLDGGPLEFEREPRSGHGSGRTITVARRHFVPHVRGFSYVGTPADEFATDAELAAATSWDRVTQYQKNAPFIALRTTESTPGTTP